MEMATVKSELSLGRRHVGMMTEGEPKAVVKRRRRDTSSSAAVLDPPCHDTSQASTQAPPAATTVKRSSRFRGVSRHRWTGRFEAHLWDKGSWNPTQRKKGKQVYLGAYDEEEAAARAYDLAALKYWGTSTSTNFPVSDYEKEIEIMLTVTKEEYLASLRRRSSGFSRGVSRYRGVARHHHNGRWEARIGRVFGNKYLYLGTYGTQEEAAHAYDIAAIEYRGINAVTNFDLSRYIRWLKPQATIAQEPHHLHQQQQTIVSQPMTPTSSNYTPTSPNYTPTEEQPHPPLFHPNPFSPDPIIPISPSAKSSSSPTALGLLFRSSVFQELVGRNFNATEEGTDEIDTKNLPVLPYKEMGNIRYMCPTSDALPGLDAQEERTLPLPMYNRAGQSLWNGSLTMSSSIN